MCIRDRPATSWPPSGPPATGPTRGKSDVAYPEPVTSQENGAQAVRAAVASAHRLVVKVGSSSLTDAGGILDRGRLGTLADAIAERRLAGAEVVLVSSGAIAAGIIPLGLSARPRDLATQQAAASVGQGALIAAYTEAFGRHGLTAGQVLLTAADLNRGQHYMNCLLYTSRCV